ncbi:hypothetical protein SAMN05216370_2867 [Pseudomonas peli]|uniref:Uncharacterized protein n=1 Tax=Pseudomonas peli TaxID=592361 RepID=A0AB37Z954_9PSED|nr:hypothetical protein [Pseudomonas peli]NMZ70448.1 hypothetical protein [Pseudomonas peli]SCW69285.1 hypothetical protein SAMN05216370_2867 [Pseudomonas peli]
MTTPHNPRTPAPSTVSHKRIAPLVISARIRLSAIRLAAIKLIPKATLPKPTQADLPNSLFNALHEFNTPQRPS